jgi:hypothetical protein
MNKLSLTEEARQFITDWEQLIRTETLYPLFIRMLKELEGKEALERWLLRKGGKDGTK